MASEERPVAHLRLVAGGGEEATVARLDAVGEEPTTPDPAADLRLVGPPDSPVVTARLGAAAGPSQNPDARPQRTAEEADAPSGAVADLGRVVPSAPHVAARTADLDGAGRAARTSRRGAGPGAAPHVPARRAPGGPGGPAAGRDRRRAERGPDLAGDRPADRPRPHEPDRHDGDGPAGGQDRRRGWRPGPRPIDPDADPVAAAREICLNLLTDRARTKHELADALRRREVPDEAAAAVLDRFDEVGLIDDAAFASQWVRSRQRTRGLARRALAVELRRKGVEDEVAAEALAEVDSEAEEERARELVARKLRTVTADTPEQRATAARRLVGMLARKGYPGGIAYRVVREALAAHGAEEDELPVPD